MFRAIVFDFDGVILESVAIKGQAFRDLFPGEPALQDRIERYHLDNLGQSRFDKFEWMYRELLGRPLTQADAADLDSRFRASIARQMRSCAFVPGAREFLMAHVNRVPMFVASGTPREELQSIVDDRGLAPFFRGVYGHPTRKADALRTIASELDARPETLLFIGDGRQDAEAARETGVTFVARVTRDADDFGAVPAMSVVDLTELANRFQDLVA